LLGGGQLDLVAKTLSDFRTQRPSVVQNLSQFVLCYESILEWAVAQMPGESPG
jgi:protein-tyrosine phosphatase